MMNTFQATTTLTPTEIAGVGVWGKGLVRHVRQGVEHTAVGVVDKDQSGQSGLTLGSATGFACHPAKPSYFAGKGTAGSGICGSGTCN